MYMCVCVCVLNAYEIHFFEYFSSAFVLGYIRTSGLYDFNNKKKIIIKRTLNTGCFRYLFF